MTSAYMSNQPKSQSVTQQGAPDGFVPPMAYQSQVLDGGYTRLEVSAPPSKLSFVHKKLVAALQAPLKIRYVRMIDRIKGQLPKPESFVAVEVSMARILEACTQCQTLFYHDGRNQIWIRGAGDAQIVLDELGMIYVYPDDFLFRDVLQEAGWIEAKHESMAERDYVKVFFDSDADAQEQTLLQSLGMIRWEG